MMAFGIESFDFGIGVELIEIAHTEGKIGVGEEFHGFGFLHAHEEGIYIRLQGTFLQKRGKDLSSFFHPFHIGYGLDGLVFFSKLRTVDQLGIAYDDAHWDRGCRKGLCFHVEIRVRKAG